jgi:hypothetical protein
MNGCVLTDNFYLYLLDKHIWMTNVKLRAASFTLPLKLQEEAESSTKI